MLKKSFKYQPIAEEGKKKFMALLVNTEWDSVYCECPTESANNMNALLMNLMNECFPYVWVKYKSTDCPWVTNKYRRLVRKRKRIFKREGRSDRWKRAKKKTEELAEKLKKEYFEKMKKVAFAAKNSKCYYKAVKMLGGKEAPKTFDIRVLFPGKSDAEIVEELAAYFNRISNEFVPLGKASAALLEHERKPPEMCLIAARLKSFKKPNSRVEGDLPPALVTEAADILAIPLHHINSQIYKKLEWPELWRSETANVIPKTSTPTDMTQLRNLSRTPLFSKLLESFILDDLKEETKLSNNQYGGLKGVGANHFLIGSWQSIIEPLEDNRAAVSVLSIDFEKAFNRMCHGACLRALQELGATQSTLGLVHAFLWKRKMSVRLGETKSVPRPVPGGSPQGSILGNYLFCATTDQLTKNINYNTPENHSLGEMSGDLTVADDVGPGTLGPVGDAWEELSSEEEQTEPLYNDSALDESIKFFRVQQRFEFDSDEEIERSYTQSQIDAELGVPSNWQDKSPDLSLIHI